MSAWPLQELTNEGRASHKQSKNARGTPSKPSSLVDLLDTSVMMLSRTKECFRLIEADPRLDCNLPPRGSLPGQVLKHCFRALDTHLERGSPLMYKIGYTHSAYHRFYNSKFGYVNEWRNKWEGMTVVFASADTVPASFVEAAMIQRFMGSLSQWCFASHYMFQCCGDFHLFGLVPHHLRQTGMQE